MKATCPSIDALKQYAIGDLDDASGDAIEQHLASCSDCGETVARFDSTVDSLMRHLPLAANASGDKGDDSPAWLDQLRNGPPEELRLERDESSIAPAEPLAGISGYELLGVLGRGGMGVVYRARHRQLNRLVAIKVLDPRLMATETARRRFEREIRILGGLHHPGIVMATDANRIGGAAYLVMELIDGVDLSRMVRLGGPLSIADACVAAKQIADALAAAHRAGTVHRDVKPSNVMVDRAGRVKLLDFGLAHLTEFSTESLETSLGRLLGTLDYMAPEQAEASEGVDHRADLFGLGATLFYLLTGQPPHGDRAGRSLVNQLRSVVGGEIPRVSTLRADVPAELDAFVAKLLSRNAAERPESAEAASTELTAWADGSLLPRVTELLQREAPSADTSDAAGAAVRSLSELLGPGVLPEPVSSVGVSPSALVGPSVDSAPPKRRWPRFIAAAGLIASVVYGVVILVETSKGTLRIESDVADVRVELVDENDQVEELRVEGNEKETTLSAGRHRIRLAPGHDHLKIDRDVITIERGKEVVAKVTRVERGATDSVANSSAVPMYDADPLLFQGKSEAEWERLLKAETSPADKLVAGRALLSIIASMPTNSQFESLLSVGEEIVRSGGDDEGLQYVLNPTDLRSLPRWDASDEAVVIAHAVFEKELQRHVDAIPLPQYTEYFARAVSNLENNDVAQRPRFLFAASLLRRRIESIRANPTAAKAMAVILNPQSGGTTKKALCLLLRARVIEQLPQAVRQAIFDELDQFGQSFRQLQVSDQVELREDLFAVIAEYARRNGDFASVPVSLRKTMAEVAFHLHVHSGSPEWNDSGLPDLHDARPYSANYVAELRRALPFYFDQSLALTNGYLRGRASEPRDTNRRGFAGAIPWILSVYSDGDEWPVDDTAAVLTESLRGYYSTDPNEATAERIDNYLPLPPDELLAQIVRVTGEIPEFVRTGTPRIQSVIDKRRKMEAFLLDKPEEHLVFSQPGYLQEDPYAAIRLTVANQSASDKTYVEVRGNLLPVRPRSLLECVSVPASAAESPSAVQGIARSIRQRGRRLREESRVDALLVLAVLADVADQGVEQDERIASILTIYPEQRDQRIVPVVAESTVPGDLKGLLHSPLKSRVHAEKFLRKLVAGAKSPQLIDAIKAIDPKLVEGIAPTATDAK